MLDVTTFDNVNNQWYLLSVQRRGGLLHDNRSYGAIAQGNHIEIWLEDRRVCLCLVCRQASLSTPTFAIISLQRPHEIDPPTRTHFCGSSTAGIGHRKYGQTGAEVDSRRIRHIGSGKWRTNNFSVIFVSIDIAFRQIQIRDDSQGTLSLHKLVTQTSENRDYSKPQDGLRLALLDHLQEIETELETSSENLSTQAALHIHSSELILTLGHSRSVENFLKSASKERKFEVVVAECAPACRVRFQWIVNWKQKQLVN